MPRIPVLGEEVPYGGEGVGGDVEVGRLDADAEGVEGLLLWEGRKRKRGERRSESETRGRSWAKVREGERRRQR